MTTQGDFTYDDEDHVSEDGDDLEMTTLDYEESSGNLNFFFNIPSI